MEVEFITNEVKRLFNNQVMTDSENQNKEFIVSTEKELLGLNKSERIDLLNLKMGDQNSYPDSIFASAVDYTIGLKSCLDNYSEKEIRNGSSKLDRLDPLVEAISKLKSIIQHSQLLLEKSKNDYSELIETEIILDSTIKEELYLVLGSYYLVEIERLEELYENCNKLLTKDLPQVSFNNDLKDIRFRGVLTDLRLLSKDLDELKQKVLIYESEYILSLIFTKEKIESIVVPLVRYKNSLWLVSKIDDIHSPLVPIMDEGLQVISTYDNLAIIKSHEPYLFDLYQHLKGEFIVEETSWPVFQGVFKKGMFVSKVRLAREITNQDVQYFIDKVIKPVIRDNYANKKRTTDCFVTFEGNALVSGSLSSHGQNNEMKPEMTNLLKKASSILKPKN